jgi:cell division protein FtsW
MSNKFPLCRLVGMVTRVQQQRHQMDYVMFFTVLILCGVGVLTVFSASTAVAIQSYGYPPAYFAVRQLIWSGIGLAAMFLVSRISYKFWYKYSALLMAGSWLLLLLVLVPGIGTVANGGRRWIGSGSVHLQPSELAIIVTVVYFAFFFTKQVALIHNFKRGLLPALIVAAITFGLIFLEPDMGTAMTLLATCMVVVFASGARLKPLFILGGALTPVLLGLALLESYRSDRIKAWLHPFQYANNEAYQLIHGLTAISAGGWFGRGFDMSLEKLGYLPYPFTDFIFAIFTEEWGLVGAVALLTTFGVLIWRGFYTARHSPDRFGALLATGLTGMITLKTIINLGAVTGLLPVTGIPLPFISYGGTSLVMNMMAVGVLLSISRYTLDVEPESDQLAEVIPVEDVEQLRDRKLRSEEPELPRRKVSQRKGADVHLLRLRRQPKSAQIGTWRSRQEAAATSRRRSQASRPSTTVPLTWRERKELSRSGSHKNTSGREKRGTWFRKDR